MSEGFLPSYELIDIGAITVLAIVIVGLLAAVASGRLHLPFGRRVESVGKVGGGVRSTAGERLAGVIRVLLLDVTTARVLNTCDRRKQAVHISIFWGFVFTAIATTLAFFMKREGDILALTHPVKIFGNIGGALLVVGCVGMFFIRYQESGSPWHLTRADFFLITLFLSAVAGFGIEQAIYTYGRTGLITTVAYWTHIVLVSMLFLTAPFSKFVHAIYKPSWILRDQLDQKIMAKREPGGVHS